MKTFKEKQILVTGASSGIGRACAIRLAAEGARLVLLGRDEEALAAVAAEADNAVVKVADLVDQEAVAAVMKELKASGGALDGWVLAAGAHHLRPIMMESAATLETMWQANVLSSVGLIARAIKSRLVAKGASIVFLSSVAARAGGAGAVSYASTKGALEGAVCSMALELSGQGIRVNAVAPGIVNTPMSEAYLSRLPEEQVERLRQHHVLGVGSPEDVAGPVAFLLSDDARWITGTVLVVDGGYSAA